MEMEKHQPQQQEQQQQQQQHSNHVVGEQEHVNEHALEPTENNLVSVSKTAVCGDRVAADDATELTVSEDEGALDLDDDSDYLDSLAPSRPRSRSRSGVRRSQCRARSAVSITSDAEPMTFNVEIARKNAAAMKESTETVELGVSMSDIGNVHALRGKANTPASLFTDFSELKALEDNDTEGFDNQKRWVQRMVKHMPYPYTSSSSRKMACHTYEIDKLVTDAPSSGLGLSHVSVVYVTSKMSQAKQRQVQYNSIHDNTCTMATFVHRSTMAKGHH